MSERRTLSEPGLGLETREEGDLVVPIMRGHASVFDSWTTLYEGTYLTYREIIRPGAYADAIREAQDVRLLFNHDPTYVLARTISGTLKLSEDERGLLAIGELLDSPTIRDLVIGPVKRGDITGMSFGFTVRPGGETRTEYEHDGRTYVDRELTALNLFDVSVVTYPAYRDTDVNIRSFREQDAALAARRKSLQLLDVRLRLAETV